ncbi:SH3 domain-containing protein [Frankia gtarii]|uniref:SH3 domain-containing protein n=1 Tax=Frankia gtarii TaxID=2950102 RepID=UPI0021BECEFE|nr:SH3 domain-containing protein [Frankia gtarii]
MLLLQRSAGNASVARMMRSPGRNAVQRCASDSCGCVPEENTQTIHRSLEAATPVRREGANADAPSANSDTTPEGSNTCGPGSANPFCLPIPGEDTPCKPFASHDHALSVWASLSGQVPLVTAAATRCPEVAPVWEAYFAGTSAPFSFAEPSSCVVAAAKRDPEGSATAKAAAAGLFTDILDNLPTTLRSVVPTPFPLGGLVAVLRIPLEQAIGTRDKVDLRPDIIYNDPFNAAANLAGAVGGKGQGSDIFGDDERLMGGTVVVEIQKSDPLGIMTGQVRWVPHVHVKDTVDLCPGNLGASFQRQFTVPMSKLEAEGLTRDVPITIDYDLDLMESGFSVAPLIGPLPGPPASPPDPPSQRPTSGPAMTTGSSLRIRSGPGLQQAIVGLLPERGTRIDVIAQVPGDPVDGNDTWDRIDQGFVADRFVAFDDTAGNP